MPPITPQLLSSLKQHAGNVTYLGSSHESYHISNPIKHKMAKEFLKTHKDISFKEFVGLLDALFAAGSYDEKSMAAMLIGYAKMHRGLLTPKHIDTCFTKI